MLIRVVIAGLNRGVPKESGRIILALSLVMGLLTLPSCAKRAGDEISTLDDLAFDSQATNVALIFGARNGLAGVATDVQEMSRVLSDASYGFTFTTESNVDSSKQQIIDAIKSKSAKVGDRGTLALYFSGHGTSDGRFVTTQGYLGFDEVTSAIRAGRGGRPVKRVLVFNDSCYSGNWIDGANGMTGAASLLDGGSTEGPNGRGSVALDAKDGDKFAEGTTSAISRSMQAENRRNEVFEQLMIMSASRDSETSLDLGASNGGAFTYSLRKVLGRLKSGKPNAKMKDMIQDTVDLTKATYRHTPQFKAFPANMLEGTLFGKTAQAAVPTAVPTAAPTVVPTAVPTTVAPTVPTVVATVTPAVTTPVVVTSSETSHMAAVLGMINRQLDACEMKQGSIALAANSQGWYKIQVFADYADGSSSSRYFAWVNLGSTPEEESKRFMKVLPGSYFPKCKKKLSSSSTLPFAKERNHFAKTLNDLNAKLSGCSVRLDKMNSGVDASGVYRFLFSATYADGSKSEQRGSWGQIGDSSTLESAAFLRAIPNRYFDKCAHK